MVEKRVLLINRDGRRWWLNQKTDESLWEGEEEIFASEAEAGEKGWKIDAVKIVFPEFADEKKKVKLIE